MKKHHIIVMISSLCIGIANANTNVSPYIRIRSQGCNEARLAQGTAHFYQYAYEQSQDGHFYYNFNIMPQYSKSNKPGRMAESLFGTVAQGSAWDVATITISGSGVKDRGTDCELLADYFGLPRDFKSLVLLKPRIDNFIAHGDLYLGFNNITPGLWARLYMPYAHTRWSLNMQECVTAAGTANHQPGYFNDAVTFGTEDPAGTYADAYGVLRQNLLNSFTQFVSEKKVPSLGATVTFCPLTHARFAPDKSSEKRKSTLADIHIDIGYNIYQTNTSHIALGIACVAPTGTRPEGIFAFEPMVGNGHHWELGGLFTSHHQIFADEKNNDALSIQMNARVTHLFAARQKRTFDLVGKPNSRYMLAQKMTRTTQNLFTNNQAGDVGGSIAPTAQFDNCFAPVANISTIDADVAIGWQADAVIMFAYSRGSMSWDIGYNIWGYGCESIKPCPSNACLLNKHLWSLKGDAHVYGFSGDATAPNTDPIALSASQSEATATQGTNTFVSTDTNLGGIDGIRPTRNPGVDHAAFARKTATASGTTQNINDRPDNLAEQTKTSSTLVFITVDDFDTIGAQTKGLSHSFFAGICYAWDHFDGPYIPYVSAGGQAEFHQVDRFCTRNEKHTCTITTRSQTCSSYRFCGISQWSVWLKAGISYH